MKKTDIEQIVDERYNEYLNLQSQLKCNIIRLCSDKYLLKEELKEIIESNNTIIPKFTTLSNFFINHKKEEQKNISKKELKAMGIEEC